MATGKICRIRGCKNILKRQDGQVCGMHRSRFIRHGNYEISPNWPNLKKGKPFLTKLGYMRININGKRVLQHRYVMEQHLGRKLTSNERIHHKNFKKTDNRIENLELFPNNSEHIKTHHPDMWKKRKTSIQYSPQDIIKIIEHLSVPTGNRSRCFCKKKSKIRNLCETHYQWAYKHNFT